MQIDRETLQIKDAEIRDYAEAVAKSFGSTSNWYDGDLIGKFVHLTAPEDPEPVMHLITISNFTGSGAHGMSGQSRKPGNILLNWRKLIDILPDVTIAGAGAVGAPVWLTPLIALYVWNKLWNGAEEQLSDVEATTILALWKNRSGQNKIDSEVGFAATNKLRSTLNFRVLERVEFETTLNRLLDLKCIEIEDGVVWLREWVRVSY